MRIRIVKKLLALMWYKIGQEFEVVRESKAQLGNSHYKFITICFLATYIVKVEGIERMVLRQDAEVMEESRQHTGKIKNG
jgi:hypothetical protein